MCVCVYSSTKFISLTLTKFLKESSYKPHYYQDPLEKNLKNQAHPQAWCQGLLAISRRHDLDSGSKGNQIITFRGLS